MSDPYRDGESREAAEAPRDGGIVGDVIAQFADPHAFYRELVQNSIDAGSPSVEVELVYEESDARMHVSVRDRGEGMTREIIENQLLVLFRSTKEKDSSKIGKFGVGFASVLSPNPEVVVVNSSCEGKRLTLHLYRDLTYELFDAGRATQAGTTVELEIALERGAVDEFERASEAALRRWCRHASVPIEVSIRRGPEHRELRIDTPLAIGNTHVEVQRTFDDGKLTIVAGLPIKPGPYLGFFNHGLMLHETTSDAIAKVAVKVQDSRLGHTISRDDVRRDAAYRHALQQAKEVVSTTLANAVSERLRELPDLGRYVEYCRLLDAALAAELDPGRWHFPLVDKIGDKTSVTDEQLPDRVWSAASSTPLTQALASSGVAILHVTERASLAAALELKRKTLVDVHHELTWVDLVEPSDTDIAVVAAFRTMLDRVHRAPADVVLVTLVGARDDMCTVALKDASIRILDRDDAVKNPFQMFGRRVLGLSTGHPHVKAAREAPDPILAAAHLVRAVLLQHGLLDADRSRKLLELTLKQIGVSA